VRSARQQEIIISAVQGRLSRDQGSPNGWSIDSHTARQQDDGWTVKTIVRRHLAAENIC
jgi:hypothetical protein